MILQLEPVYIRIAACTGTILALVVAVFQVLLAWGLPFGEAAWGGRHRVLPPGLRIASALAVIVWLGAALLFLERGDVISIGINPSVTKAAVWILTPLLGVGVLANAVSRSRKERLWAPFVAVLFVASLFLATSG